MKLLRIALFFFISILFLLSSTLANAEEVPDTKLTNKQGSKWRCDLDNAGQKTLRVDPFTSGRPDRKPCPVYQEQQSTCIELSDGVACEYNTTGSPGVQPGGQTGGLSWTITPNNKQPGEEYIDGNTPTVTITFSGLADDNLYLYPKTDQTGVRLRRGALSQIKSESGTITLTVCGNGRDALKGERIGKGKKCSGNESDYFHEGNVYRLGLYDDENGEAQLMVAEFYVRNSAPIIKIGLSPRGTLPALTAALSGRRPGGGDRNNYQLVLTGAGNYSNNQCIQTNKSNQTIPLGTQEDFLTPAPAMGEDNPASIIFTRGESKSGLMPGTYTLKLRERVDDTGLGQVKGGCNGGGITYVELGFNLAKDGSITDIKAEFDPDGIDTLKLEEQLSTFAPIPCADLEPPDPGDPEKPRMCKKVRTAIGLINVSAEGFVNSLFRFVLVIAGFGAIIIIIYSGYVLATSQGNKEKIAAARETLTSAILGLLFIIFSIVILEIIGVDILRIPGLTR